MSDMTTEELIKWCIKSSEKPCGIDAYFFLQAATKIEQQASLIEKLKQEAIIHAGGSSWCQRNS